MKQEDKGLVISGLCLLTIAIVINSLVGLEESFPLICIGFAFGTMSFFLGIYNIFERNKFVFSLLLWLYALLTFVVVFDFFTSYKIEFPSRLSYYAVEIKVTYLNKSLSDANLTYSAFLYSPSTNEKVPVDIGNSLLITTDKCTRQNCISVRDGTYYLYVEVPIRFCSGGTEIYRAKIIFDLKKNSPDYNSFKLKLSPAIWDFEKNVYDLRRSWNRD